MPSARKPTLRGRRPVRALRQLLRIHWTSPDAKWGTLLPGGAVALELGAVQASVYVWDAQRRRPRAPERMRRRWTLAERDGRGVLEAA